MIHVLHPRPKYWTFDKGDFEQRSNHHTPSLEHIHNIDYVKAHSMELYERIRVLYSKLASKDESIQSKIDSHLAICGLILRKMPLGKTPYQSCIMQVSDAPQFGNAPDIGFLLRQCLAHNLWGSSMLGVILHACFPCPKPLLKTQLKDHDVTVPVILNIILVFFLGLFPNTNKTPPFSTRVEIYVRMHELLTQTMQQQLQWVQGNIYICYLAMSEYLCKVLPCFFPVEYEVVKTIFPVGSFFTETLVFYDIFRQDSLEFGTETWDKLNTAAKECYEKLHRVYRSKCRCKNMNTSLRKKHLNMHTFTIQDIHDQLHQKVIRLYPFHSSYPNQLISEYEILGIKFSGFCLSNYVSVHDLPGNIQQEQLKIFHRQAGVCQRRAHMRRMLYVCLYCEIRNKTSLLRLKVGGNTMVCEECATDACVIGIDTIGRVVSINTKQFFYSLCCGCVVLYQGTMGHWTVPVTRKRLDYEKIYNLMNAEDFILNKGKINLIECGCVDVEECVHTKKKNKEKKRTKSVCFICKTVALPDVYEYFDLGTRKMHLLYCCQKHTPNHDWLKNVLHYQQFEDAVYAWETKQHQRKMRRIGVK